MRLIVICLLTIAYCLAASAEKRAFIVGVGDYENLTDLRKTVGDAEGYRDLFGTDLDFEVTMLIDPSHMEFVEAFGVFLESIQEGDEVVFVFSGHGWTDSAENYLIMADAPSEASAFSLKSQTVPLSTTILSELRDKQPQLVLGIIDACRENPFDGMTKGIVRVGLVPAQVSEGMLLMFAAGDRQLALDRLGPGDPEPYSVFTRSLLPMLRDSDRPLQDIARDVKDDVRDLAMAINHDQRPAYYDELLGDYCLSGKCVARLSEEDPEMQAWISASSANIVDRCEKLADYVATYPEGAFSAEAQAMISEALCGDEQATFREHSLASNDRYRTLLDHMASARALYAKADLRSAQEEYRNVIEQNLRWNLIDGSPEILEAHVRFMEIELQITPKIYRHSHAGKYDEYMSDYGDQVADFRSKRGLANDVNAVAQVSGWAEGLYYINEIRKRKGALIEYRAAFCDDPEQLVDADAQSFGKYRIPEPWLSRFKAQREEVNCSPTAFETEVVKAVELVGLATKLDQDGFSRSIYDPWLAEQYLEYIVDLISTEPNVDLPKNILQPYVTYTEFILQWSSEDKRLLLKLTEMIDFILSEQSIRFNIDPLEELTLMPHGESAFVILARAKMHMVQKEYIEAESFCSEFDAGKEAEDRFGPFRLGEPWVSELRAIRANIC